MRRSDTAMKLLRQGTAPLERDSIAPGQLPAVKMGLLAKLNLLTVGLEVEKLTRVRVIFRQHVRRGDEELVTGVVEIACVDTVKMTPAAIPEFLHSKLEALK